MSLTSVSGSSSHGLLGGYDADVRSRVEEDRPGRVSTPRPGRHDVPPHGGRGAGSGDVPAGTDPNVWHSLSLEERAFFARMEASGALSYGPTSVGGALPMYRGRFLHIKV